MKKVFFLFAVVLSATLISCGSEATVEEPVVTEEETVESDTVQVSDTAVADPGDSAAL